jgi:haloalkane dehalogenase
VDTTPTTNRGHTVTTHAVTTAHGRLHVADRAGVDPTFVLMHGFPDDSRIYGRVTPLLAPQRVVSFDFIGHGRSDRPEADGLSTGHHQDELAAVLDSLGVEHPVLVAHDASGPVAIDFALAHPSRVNQLILLNTYYGHAASLRLPEMIRLFADPTLTPLADAMLNEPDQRLWLLGHTARRFGIDPADPDSIGAIAVVPQFFGDIENPDALAAIRDWTAALFDELDRQDTAIAEQRLGASDLPVALVFGVNDEYLNPGLAHHLASLFRHSDLHIVEGASHWPQWDQPEIAQLFHRTVTA